MKIGFISDTHGDYDMFMRALEIFDNPDFIVHTGDVLGYGHMSETNLTRYIKSMSNIYLVRGNGDYFDSQKLISRDLEYEKIFNFKKDNEKDNEIVKVFASHSHRDSINNLYEKAYRNKVDILAFGHTHRKKLDRYDNLIVINPGSTTYPRDLVPSCGILNTSENLIYLVNLLDGKIIKSIQFRV